MGIQPTLLILLILPVVAVFHPHIRGLLRLVLPVSFHQGITQGCQTDQAKQIAPSAVQPRAMMEAAVMNGMVMKMASHFIISVS